MLIIYQVLLNHHNDPNQNYNYYHPHVAYEETKTEWLRNLPKATQPGSGRGGIQIQTHSEASICNYYTTHTQL